jgi:hypothetical protein
MISRATDLLRPQIRIAHILKKTRSGQISRNDIEDQIAPYNAWRQSLIPEITDIQMALATLVVLLDLVEKTNGK